MIKKIIQELLEVILQEYKLIGNLGKSYKLKKINILFYKMKKVLKKKKLYNEFGPQHPAAVMVFLPFSFRIKQ